MEDVGDHENSEGKKIGGKGKTEETVGSEKAKYHTDQASRRSVR